MGNEYNLLFEAIWKQALVEELAKQKFRLLIDVLRHIYPEAINLQKHYKSQAELASIIIQVYPVEINKIIKLIEHEIDKTDLKKIVQIKIYKESQRWPRNPRELDSTFEKRYLNTKNKLLSHIDTLVLTRYNKIG